MDRFEEISRALAEAGLDGWLFYDFRLSDPLAYRILGLPETGLATRRWFYFVPAAALPRALVSAVEAHRLDALPVGMRIVYRSEREMISGLARLVEGCRRIAMNYSPMCAIPYVSRVDAGTLELVRATGVEVVSAADLIQRFEAVLTAAPHFICAQSWTRPSARSHGASARTAPARSTACSASCSSVSVRAGCAPTKRRSSRSTRTPPTRIFVQARRTTPRSSRAISSYSICSPRRPRQTVSMAISPGWAMSATPCRSISERRSKSWLRRATPPSIWSAAGSLRALRSLARRLIALPGM